VLGDLQADQIRVQVTVGSVGWMLTWRSLVSPNPDPMPPEETLPPTGKRFLDPRLGLTPNSHSQSESRSYLVLLSPI